MRNGTKNAGKIYYFNGTDWKITQEKTKVNQAPYLNYMMQVAIVMLHLHILIPVLLEIKFFIQRRNGANDPELGF